MKKYIFNPGIVYHDTVLLFFRVLFSLELIVVHGMKKLDEHPTEVPNPFHIPVEWNYAMAVLGNTLFPLLVLFGFFTRIAVMPILMITLTGYFVVHHSDALAIKDVPFMYSLVGLFLLFAGAGKYSVDYLIYSRQKS